MALASTAADRHARNTLPSPLHHHCIDLGKGGLVARDQQAGVLDLLPRVVAEHLSTPHGLNMTCNRQTVGATDTPAKRGYKFTK